MTPERRTAVESPPDEVRQTTHAVRRVVIERVWPEIDAGRFAIKRTVGERVTVSADVFADGHDRLAGVLKYRRVLPAHPDLRQVAVATTLSAWEEVPLVPLGNDRWHGSFVVTELGAYEYTLEAWIDRFGSWLDALIAKSEARQDVAGELLEGAALIQQTAERSRPHDARQLLQIASTLRSDQPMFIRLLAARDPGLRALMDAGTDRSSATTYDRILTVSVDSVRARFGAWYEMFPRSCTDDPRRSGTFREAESRLHDIAAMGFDVVYLPPIHPIGATFRKGRNNAPTASPGDPGSPWAIGSPDGGHTAIDPALGTMDDFDRFVALAKRLELEVALDIAVQTSPDHPWVVEHPAWFRHRPDGSIKYAENPPKKYQDIYPLDFENDAWRSLWAELRDVFRFWLAHGVRIFRVDNPHTKPLVFWEWVIDEIRRDRPDAIFLSEAFTRPKVMHYLAKAGFSQSYTYFTWRNSADELREYVNELNGKELREYLRPNFFANTPDILHAYLQTGGRSAFAVRVIVAATLSASYGIYSGFELCENLPVAPGSEEYLDSEKYELKPRNWNQAGTLRELIARLNGLRRDYPALQQNTTLSFHDTDNPQFLFFSKRDASDPPDASSPPILVVVNLDPHWAQHGWVRVPLGDLGLRRHDHYVVEDLLDGARYVWHGEWNYVKLDPSERVAHILVVRGTGTAA